jgi:hypothetical protein
MPLHQSTTTARTVGVPRRMVRNVPQVDEAQALFPRDPPGALEHRQGSRRGVEAVGGEIGREVPGNLLP